MGGGLTNHRAEELKLTVNNNELRGDIGSSIQQPRVIDLIQATYSRQSWLHAAFVFKMPIVSRNWSSCVTLLTVGSLYPQCSTSTSYWPIDLVYASNRSTAQ